MRHGCLPLTCLCAWASLAAGQNASYEAAGADGVRYRLSKTPDALEVTVVGAGVDRPDQTVFLAWGRSAGAGSPLIPPSRGEEGAAVWLPFPAEVLLAARRTASGEEKTIRRWQQTRWGPRESAGDAFSVTVEPAQVLVRVPDKLTGRADRLELAVYLKDMASDDGSGRFYGGIDRTTVSGPGERVIRHHLVMERSRGVPVFRRAGRTDPGAPKVRLYQLLPRLFGNTNETRTPHGTLAENGTGKFSDLGETALGELKATGFTHLWLTGVLRHVTATDYPDLGEPPDDPDLLKGMAGSPLVVRDYFDVSPDCADDPARRGEEFQGLIERVQAAGLKVLIDFVPNHVARSYHSTAKPESTLGARDDRSKFFDPQNNFFYLTGDVAAEGGGPPLLLPTVDGNGRPTSPTVQMAGGGDGLFDGEKEFGRATGDGVVSWSPGAGTWYDTVKLNYGYDFTDPEKATRRYPHGTRPDLPVPDTWQKMDAIIAHWQQAGVDGFRAGGAHLVPPEFWRWLIGRSRGRDPGVYWLASARDEDGPGVPGGDPRVAEVTRGAVRPGLLEAGFDAVEDDPSREALRQIYEGTGTAHDLDETREAPFLFDNALRFAENHDTVRLAAAGAWGGAGLKVGRPVCALLFGLSRGPVMIYHGQEVGEPAAGAEGFGGDDGRTTIHDYWSMPEFVKWVNGGRFDGGGLSGEQRSLRDFYRRLLAVVDEPAFRDGDFFPLNPANRDNEHYGRVDGGSPGHWLYAYLRHDPATGQRMLAVVNLHPREAMRDVRVRFPRRALRFLGWDALAGSTTVPVVAQDRLGEVPADQAVITTTPHEMEGPGLPVTVLQPLTAAFYELRSPVAP